MANLFIKTQAKTCLLLHPRIVVSVKQVWNNNASEILTRKGWALTFCTVQHMHVEMTCFSCLRLGGTQLIQSNYFKLWAREVLEAWRAPSKGFTIHRIKIIIWLLVSCPCIFFKFSYCWASSSYLFLPSTDSEI